MKPLIIITLILLAVGTGIFVSTRDKTSTSPQPVVTDTEVPTSSGLTPTLELVNAVWSKEAKWKDIITTKTTEAATNPEALKELAFAQSFVGDLKSAEVSLDLYCDKNPESGSCKKIQYVFDIKKPLDNQQKPLTGTSFEVIGKPATTQKIQKEGVVTDTTYKNTVVRTKITKKGYTDFITKSSHIGWDENTDSQEKVSLTPVMLPAEKSVTKKHTESYQVTTKNYTFTVQPETFTYADGTLAEGDIEVYFFDITADTPNAYASGMFSLDVFDRASGTNMGEGMETYGMPLVKAYKGDIELFVKKPIIGVGRMSNMEDFKTRNGLQEIDFATIPKNTPIDFAAALKYNLPPFWQYQKKTGTWETSTFQVLDNTGLSQFSFQDL